MKEDSQIVSFSPRNWHHHFWQHHKIFTNPNKFNGINHSPFNKLSATNKTPLPPNYSPLNTAFNILLSSAGSKIYSSITSLFSVLLPSKNQPKSVVQEYKTKEEKRETAEKKEDDQNNINNLITSKESQPFTSLITKVKENSQNTLSLLGYVATSTASNIIESCQEGSKYNLCTGKANNVLGLLLQRTCSRVLIFSIMDNHHLTAKILLFLGTDPNIKLFTFTPLETAILERRDEIAELLIKNGANLNTITEKGNAPLHLAITMERPAVAELLITKGANLNIPTKEGDTPLNLALKIKSPAVAELLIKNGANLNIPTKEGDTPLHLALQMNRPTVAELLIKNGANLNIPTKEGDTPLHLALKMDRPAVAELLIKNGANLESRDADGNTPLHLAVQKNNDELATLMIQKGAVINAKDKEGYPPVYYAITSNFTSDKSVKLLLQHDASFDFCQQIGDNPILLAAKKPNWDVLKALIEDVKLFNSININACDSQGRTALYYAISFHKTMLPSMRSCVYIISEASIELLLKHGANANFCSRDGDTPLLLAAQRSYWGAVKLLVEKSANVNAQDSEGKTALHYAVFRCQKDVIPFLIQNGANFTLQDNKGRTPMQIAIAIELYNIERYNIALLIYETYKQLPSKQQRLDANLVLQEMQQLVTILEAHPISVMLTRLHSYDRDHYKRKSAASAANNYPINPNHPKKNPENNVVIIEELLGKKEEVQKEKVKENMEKEMKVESEVEVEVEVLGASSTDD